MWREVDIKSDAKGGSLSLIPHFYQASIGLENSISPECIKVPSVHKIHNEDLRSRWEWVESTECYL